MAWRRSPLGFAARLGLAVSGLIALVCIAQSWLLARSGLEHLRGYLGQRGRAVAAYLATEARPALATGELDGLRQLAAQARAESDVVYTRFFDAQGLLLVSSGGPPGPDVWEFRAPVVAADGAGDAPELGAVAVGVSVESLHALRRRIATTAALLTTLFVALAVLAAWCLARAFGRPLRALATAADAVARGEFGAVVEVPTRDEVGRLARSFNAMTESLARSRAALVQQVEQLQRANTLKSEFVATMSHELRTPLNVILGYAEMLRDGAAGPLAGEQGALVDAIRRSALEQRELVTSVLDFSRLSAGRVPVTVERVILRAVLADVAQRVAGRVARGVRVLVNVHPDVPALDTDRAKLADAVRHLVDNAAKFTARGTITLAARPGAPGRVVVEVADTGCGIPAEQLPHIFDAFLQLGSHRTRHTGGIGLGLAIVDSLVETLGGTVTVVSEPGRGTTFRLDLPCRLDPLPAAAAAALDEAARNASALPAETRSLEAGARRARRAS